MESRNAINSVPEPEVKEESQQPASITQAPAVTCSFIDHESPRDDIFAEVKAEPIDYQLLNPDERDVDLTDAPPKCFPDNSYGKESPRDIFSDVKAEPFDKPLLNPDEREIDLRSDSNDVKEEVCDFGYYEVDYVDSEDCDSQGIPFAGETPFNDDVDRIDLKKVKYELFDKPLLNPDEKEVDLAGDSDELEKGFNDAGELGDREDEDDTPKLDFLDPNNPRGEPKVKEENETSVVQAAFHSAAALFATGRFSPRAILTDVKVEPFDKPLLNPDERDIDLTNELDTIECGESAERWDLKDEQSVLKTPFAPTSSSDYENPQDIFQHAKHELYDQPLLNPGDTGVELTKDSIGTVKGFSDSKQDVALSDAECTTKAVFASPASAINYDNPQNIIQDLRYKSVDKPLYLMDRKKLDIMIGSDELEKKRRDSEDHIGRNDEYSAAPAAVAPVSHINNDVPQDIYQDMNDKSFALPKEKEGEDDPATDLEQLVEDVSDGDSEEDLVKMEEGDSDSGEQKGPDATYSPPKATTASAPSASSKNMKKYKCNVCNKSFVCLARHYRIHTGETPYKCEVCPKKFSRKDSLTRHERVHTGEKPYRCHLCNKRFYQWTSLNYHIRVHQDEKNFRCGVCEKQFRSKDHLKEHYHTHSGVKPFECDKCQKKFATLRYLTKHHNRCNV